MEITNEEVCTTFFTILWYILIGFLFVAGRHPPFENYPIQAPHHLSKSKGQAATTSQETFTAHT
jgi:hypothetical protein